MYWYEGLFNCINISLGGKNSTSRKLAKYKNYTEFQNVFARLVKKALARYEFEDLPDTVNERVLKLSFLYHGSACFFEEAGNVIALPATPNANLNIYGDFKSCFVYGRNGYNKEIPLYVHGGADSQLINKGFGNRITAKPKGVWVRENELVYPFLNYCINYADKIADSMRTLDVSRHNIKRPYIIPAEEQVVPTVKKFFDERNDNVDFVVSTGIFPADKVNVLQIPAGAENLKACTDLIEWYMNDFDNLCGKNSNANPDKKERLLVDEVNANNESTEANIDSLITYVQSQLDDVNDYFGTSIRIVNSIQNDTKQDAAEAEEGEKNDDDI